MKTKTFIVLFNVDYIYDSRRLAESIENQHFEIEKQSNCETVSALKIREAIINKLEIEDENKEFVSVYPLTDFMDDFNNEDLNADLYFMSYVTGNIINN